MRKTLLANSEIYHIYNRGVDKRPIFLDKDDHQRFADSLSVFNSKINLNGRRFAIQTQYRNKDPLVNIIAYCLMPNHFHLLLEQLADDGVTKFIQKMSTSYAMYFNGKYERAGALLQGAFKRSHVKTDSRLLELSKYIHSNPAKILITGDNIANMRKLLLEYPWSSFAEYAGIRTDSKILTNTRIVLDQFISPVHYVNYVVGET